MRRKRPSLKSRSGSTEGIPVSEVEHSSQISPCGVAPEGCWWHSHYFRGLSNFEDYRTDDVGLRALERGGNDCGERRRASPLDARIILRGEGPGEAFTSVKNA